MNWELLKRRLNRFFFGKRYKLVFHGWPYNEYAVLDTHTNTLIEQSKDGDCIKKLATIYNSEYYGD